MRMFCKGNSQDKGKERCCSGICFGHILMKVFLGIFLVYLIFYIGTLVRNNIRQYNFIGKAERMQNTISINGEGKETGTPNIAVTEIGLVTEKSDVASAQKENTEKMNKLISEVKKSGVKDEDIQTTNYSIYPKYDYTNGRSLLAGYTVNQTITLKIRDLTKISAILAKVGEVGVNQVSNLNFTIDDPENLRALARDKALVNAKEKAQALAKSLGVKLIKVVSYNEYNQPEPSPLYRSYAMPEGMGGGSSSPDIQTGSLDVKVDVSVIYEIE